MPASSWPGASAPSESDVSKMNETIARLDRAARRLGLELRETGVNRREFEAFGRTFRYRPGGKGIVAVETLINGKPDATVHKNIERMEELFVSALYDQESK
jgi:hypothetical protein